MGTILNEVKNDEAKALIEAINPHINISPFQLESSRVLKRALPFYMDTYFVEVTDYKDKQPRQIISLIQENDGQQGVYVLDWSNETIYKLNDTLNLTLNNDNISAYIRFFFSIVRTAEGPFKIIDTPEHVNWRDEPTTAAKRALGKMIDPLYLVNRAENGDFHLSGTIMFKQSLFSAKFCVTAKGVVEIYDQELLVDDIPATEAL